MKKITLTFDNGPDPEVTPHVLDILRRKNILASFFVLGDKLRDRRALCERARDEGHWIGNHSFNHLVPLGMSQVPGCAEREMRRTERLLEGLAHSDKFFRPFGGGGLLDERLFNEESFSCLVEDNYTCVLWNSIPRDWMDPDGWPDTALKQAALHEHTLMVLHDLPTDAMLNLESFIDQALNSGYTFSQAFPADCVPVFRGHVRAPMEPYISRDNASLSPSLVG
jgi:peptidoglycan/xylan/chitin deacetylase (PgdA/CDA1 family)